MKNSNYGRVYCTRCGNLGKPAVRVRGNVGVELLLWLLLILPGVIYSVWRSFSRYEVCSSCGSTDLIEEDSPIAQKEIAKIAELEAFKEIMERPE